MPCLVEMAAAAAVDFADQGGVEVPGTVAP